MGDSEHKIIKGIAGAALAASIVGLLGVYGSKLVSQQVVQSSVRVEGPVLQQEDVFRRISLSPDYVTQAEGIAGHLGSGLRRATNIGNVETALLISPSTISYQTRGSRLFSSKYVERNLDDTIAIISSAGVPGVEVGDSIEFRPRYIGGNMIVHRSRSNLRITVGEHQGTYTRPLIDPPGLRKVE